MQLTNEFCIPAGVDQAWAVLTDLSRVVPCLPGASLDALDGPDFTGQMAVKLGPMSLKYAGSGTLHPDEQARRIIVVATGGEQRGGGSAEATISATLSAAGATTTQVRVETDLALSGRPAQFGRGIMMEVAGRMLDSFATNLASELSSAPAGEAVARADEVSQPVARTAAEPLDLGNIGLVPALKRAVPVAAVVVVGVAIWRLRRR
ncbi:SRPBCC family protein [Demetria terragena]|uniref:SRPBCC family protein n=1 Tax=Demetria terragena TaxID=63959 RepID=UPI0003809EF5|nr:SRPBCC family protein [Demetria terragena]